MSMHTKEEIREILSKASVLDEFPQFWQNRFTDGFFAIATDKGKEDLENKAREGFLEGILKDKMKYGIPEHIYIPKHLIKTIKVGEKIIYYALAGGIYS
ncbi:MAG: hypothetical protein Q8O84_04735 [Nanoarchaeota archaeon]|nr:hypothetical protein [Nanoarchaeota archaeon]